MKNQSTPIIKHFVALIKLSSFDDSQSFIEGIAQEIISNLNLKVVKKTSYNFNPKGTTLAFILSQSHLLIHTWPESRIIHIDLVICSYRNQKEFESLLKSIFSKQKVDFIKVKNIAFD